MALSSQGKWTAEEEDKLKQLYAAKGGRWKEIGTSLGRLPEAVRDKYKSFKLGDAKKQGKWTPEEEGKLANLVQEYFDARPVRCSLPEQIHTSATITYTVIATEHSSPAFGLHRHAHCCRLLSSLPNLTQAVRSASQQE